MINNSVMVGESKILGLMIIRKLVSQKMCLDHVKVRLSPLKKKISFICFNESPLKMVKNAFYFILKGIFVLKIFKFLIT